MWQLNRIKELPSYIFALRFKDMKICRYFIYICMFSALSGFADTHSDNRQDIIIYPGLSDHELWLGYGWSNQEKHPEGMVRWISHMEADLYFVPEKLEDLHMKLRAAPLYVSWRQQKIGVYINGTYLTEWLCPAHPDLEDYRTTLPSEMLKEGTNTITLRMGYRLRLPPDSRELSLLVHGLQLTGE